jgi:hypothetical protein
MDAPAPAGRATLRIAPEQRWRVALALTLLAFFALAMLVAKSQEKGLGHDEHQFVSPGILTMREGLLPYRDYPLFHVPYLVLLHGALAAWVPYKMLVVRLFTALTAWGTVFLIGRWTWRNVAVSNVWWRVAAVGAIGILFLLPPVTAQTVQMIWNHATPVFFFIAAWVVLAGAAATERRGGRCLAAGLLLGIAAGMRLSLLPLSAPFGLAVMLMLPAASWKMRLRQTACFSAGLTLAWLPLAWFICRFPEQFFFNNFETVAHVQIWRAYPFWHPNLENYVNAAGGLLPHTPLPPRGLTFLEKLSFLRLSPMRESLIPILLGPVLTVLALIASLRHDRKLPFVPAFALLCWPFVLWGCWAPSRVNSQYYYVAVVYGALLVAVGLAGLRHTVQRRFVLSIVGLAVVAAVFLGWEEYRDVRKVYKIRNWRGVRAHEGFVALARQTGPGYVLSLNAFHLQEGGARIYPEFSSHAFPWRLAHLFPEEKRRRYQLIAAHELTILLAGRMPDAIVVGRGETDQMEVPFLEFARMHGYIPMDERMTVWRRPAADSSAASLEP